MNWSIENAHVITPHKVIPDSNIIMQKGKIKSIHVAEARLPEISLDVDHSLVFPGLINGHDHILGNYLPKVGKGPYPNWLPWDNDLKSADTYVERQQIDIFDSYLLGSYRNLLSGVTTVSDHIPHFVNEPFIDKMPIRVLRDYALAHAVASFALSWGDGIEEEYAKAKKNNIPFITHCQEGFDDETLQDTNTLIKKGALGEYSVLIHCIGLGREDIVNHAKHKSNIVWCPDSNMFMFNKTLPVKECLDQGVNVVLGTDSPMSGGMNMLTELKFAKKTYFQLYKEHLDDKQLIEMVTTKAAKALRLPSLGEIKEGKTADLLLIRGEVDRPYSSLVEAQMEDIRLMIYQGVPIYGDLEFEDIFQYFNLDYSTILVNNHPKAVIGDPWSLLKRIRTAVGYKKELAFLPIKNYS